jgi:hypothetical protein
VIVSNILGYVFYGKTNSKKGEKTNRGSITYWDDLPTKESPDFIPGYLDIHKALKSNKTLFFIENKYEVKNSSK